MIIFMARISVQKAKIFKRISDLCDDDDDTHKRIVFSDDDECEDDDDDAVFDDNTHERQG